MCSRSQIYYLHTSSTVSYLAAPSFSSAGCDVFIAPGAPALRRGAPGAMLPPVWCASHVVGEKPSQAVWDRPWVPWEGCRPRRAFPATASRRATGWASATSQDTCCRATQSIIYLGASLGTKRQIDQTRLKIDAQPASQSLICATMTIRLSLTASSPHSNAGHAGGNPTD